MKRFQFPLQTVRNVRDLKRDEAERSFAEASAVVTRAETELAQAISKRNEAVESFSQMLKAGPLDASRAAHESAYLDLLAKLISNSATRLASLKSIRESKRNMAIRAAREAEVLEKLYHQQQTRYDAFVNLDEQKNLDEFSIMSDGLRRQR